MLTSKQRAGLRKMANDLSPIFQIGKGGLNDNLENSVDEALETRELVKITILETADVTAKDALHYIAERTGAEEVQHIGRKLVLYRRSQDKPRIEI